MNKNTQIDDLRSQIRLLEKDITRDDNIIVPFGISEIDDFLSGNGLMLGKVHEVLGDLHFRLGNVSSIGFVVALLVRISEQTGTNKEILWCVKNKNIARGNLSASGLNWLGLNSNRIIQVNALSEVDMLWAIEEGLRCSGIMAVVAELDEPRKGTASETSIFWRKLQLAAEKNGVTGFMLRPNAKNINSISFVAETRWRISPCLTQDWRPKWNLQLLKARNGRSNSIPVIWDPITRSFRVAK